MRWVENMAFRQEAPLASPCLWSLTPSPLKWSFRVLNLQTTGPASEFSHHPVS